MSSGDGCISNEAVDGLANDGRPVGSGEGSGGCLSDKMEGRAWSKIFENLGSAPDNNGLSASGCICSFPPCIGKLVSGD